MKAGDEVLTVADFTQLHKAWGFEYPKLNEVVTIKTVEDYTGEAGIATIMLTFVEYPDLPAMCEDDYRGQLNFKKI